jgi:predicted NUDIX family phosphoesterase
MTEHVLVVPKEAFDELGYFQGFSNNVEQYLPLIDKHPKTSYQPRPEMEQDPTHKQLIPYCLFKCGDKFLTYKRGTGQGESRLHAKRSLGIGGHISTEDKSGEEPDFVNGMVREIAEEINFDSEMLNGTDLIGFINDDSNDVGKVHLGIIHVFDIATTDVHANEEDMLDIEFVDKQFLLDHIDEYESWSQIAIKEITK